jgi:hypothetical protein
MTASDGRASPLETAGVPEGWKLLKDTTHDERSYSEDASHENGSYSNCCVHCLRTFIGHKRRHICKVCALSSDGRASPPETAGVPDRPKVYVYRRFPGATYTSLVDPRPFPNEDVAPIEWFAIYLPPTQASDETKAAP